MKRYFFSTLIILFAVICGCVTRVENEQRLQGDSLYTDRQEAKEVYNRLLQVPECQDYVQSFWKYLNHPLFTNCPDGSSFDVRMEIYQDGRMGSVDVYGWSNAVYTPLYIDTIKQSKLPKWPKKMHSVVGKNYFVFWFSTGVYPIPVGPG
jgi:hypothetical protein